VTPFNFTYNASELQAWRSGAALASVLSNLRQPDPMGDVHVNVLAHSMGNVVVAEALRQWRLQSTEPLVDTYIAMQGAISAGAFGDDATNALPPLVTSIFDLYRYWPVGVGEPAGGRPYMSDPTNASANWSQLAATNRVNMFNALDFALTNALAWPTNNGLKPLSGNVAPFDVWQYNYKFDENGPSAGVYRVHAQTEQEQIISTDLIDMNGRPGAYAYEIMAFASVANTLPIGSQDDLDWFNVNINLDGDVSGLDENVRGLEPGIRPNHSFQFHHDLVITWDFWDRVMNEIGVSRTYEMVGGGSTQLLVENLQVSRSSENDTSERRLTPPLWSAFPPSRTNTRSPLFRPSESLRMTLATSQNLDLISSILERSKGKSAAENDGILATDTAFAELGSHDHDVMWNDWCRSELDHLLSPI
jgi:hypothetical protein